MEDFIIEKIQEIAFAKVKSDDPLWTSKVLDSITLIELIVEIENEFQIKVPLTDIVEENFETVSRMINYLNRKM